LTECSATQSGRTNESCGEYADALMELSEELNVKAINLWSAIQTRDDWLDVSFTWVHIHIYIHKKKIFFFFFWGLNIKWCVTLLMLVRDGVHLSAEGSKVVVKEILRVLREADWKTSLHWMSMPTEYAEDSPYYPPAPDGKTTINVSYCVSRRSLQWDL